MRLRLGQCCVELHYRTDLGTLALLLSAITFLVPVRSFPSILGQCISVTYSRRTAGSRDPKRIRHAAAGIYEA